MAPWIKGERGVVIDIATKPSACCVPQKHEGRAPGHLHCIGFCSLYAAGASPAIKGIPSCPAQNSKEPNNTRGITHLFLCSGQTEQMQKPKRNLLMQSVYANSAVDKKEQSLGVPTKIHINCDAYMSLWYNI